jgi:hypothetical protein
MNQSADHIINEKIAEKEELEIREFDNEKFFKIRNIDTLRPFFMSIVSDSNHWLFIASNGGLTAGRKNSDYALFPYYTDDKITEAADITGSKTIFQVFSNGTIETWEPFSDRFTGRYQLTRNLYKNIFGNKIMFEEINHDLGLTFRYQWNSSNLFGFVKKSTLENTSTNNYKIVLLDGIQNILPYGVHADLQNASSNLVDAYKRNELYPSSGIGIFALSAIIVDKAEPSEALKANIAWSAGLQRPIHLLSSLQLNAFRNRKALTPETDIKGEKGAYFVSEEISLEANSQKHWKIIANVNQNQSQVVLLNDSLKNIQKVEQEIEADIEAGTENLIALNTSADGIQSTGDILADARHFSNTLFNIMRGGIFDFNYQIDKKDLESYLLNANKEVYKAHKPLFAGLNESLNYNDLTASITKTGDADLTRLCTEYLPLKFSRRHGDPSRPWNKFSINTRSEIDGSKILDYEGNWRDIFQNWEALAHAFPEFMEGMIFKFLNASTFDGYNPYRVTKSGFDWETIEPDNPWSYIGYWGDHQVIYLLKFLEFSEACFPGKLCTHLNNASFVYAAVPYTIKPYNEILNNPKDTIEFDHHWDKKIIAQKEKIGSDGANLLINDHSIYRVTLHEKIMAMLLAKISNFIPGAGIWMNTQRPEWNDANNALVGNGVSMVTLYYLHRFIKFFSSVLKQTNDQNLSVSVELAVYFNSVNNVLIENKNKLAGEITDRDRKIILDGLGWAASNYRTGIYKNGFLGNKTNLSLKTVENFLTLCSQYIEHTIVSNKRSDKLFHSYNLMTATENEVAIEHLSEMLEGQVAVLTSGILSATEAVELLDSLRNSALYREDQNSYILYPNKSLPGFLKKNIISKDDATSSELIQQWVTEGNTAIIEQDVEGNYHFNGNFKNANDLKLALSGITEGNQAQLLKKEKQLLLDIFERVFNHKAFTGRSGTFFGYEGLGSIYWHMVSKLLLAVQECCITAVEAKETPKNIESLNAHYYNIKKGIGVHKSPKLYGAFPTDPYSHTPMHRGAQQPGMTGQVKEDILVQKRELGISVEHGKLYFKPYLLAASPNEATTGITYKNVSGKNCTVNLEEGSLFFTCCQVPVIYKMQSTTAIKVFYTNGGSTEFENHCLDEITSNKIFSRTGEIEKIEVFIL